MAKLRIKRKGYKRKDGTRVKATSYLAKDKGEKGRTPKGKRWYSPTVKTGWEKGLPLRVRRSRVLRAHGGDLLAAGRSMQALANVTTDRATRHAADIDSTNFFKRYAEKKGIESTAKTR